MMILKPLEFKPVVLPLAIGEELNRGGVDPGSSASLLRDGVILERMPAVPASPHVPGWSPGLSSPTSRRRPRAGSTQIGLILRREPPAREPSPERMISAELENFLMPYREEFAELLLSLWPICQLSAVLEFLALLKSYPYEELLILVQELLSKFKKSMVQPHTQLYRAYQAEIFFANLQKLLPLLLNSRPAALDLARLVKYVETDNLQDVGILFKQLNGLQLSEQKKFLDCLERLLSISGESSTFAAREVLEFLENFNSYGEDLAKREKIIDLLGLFLKYEPFLLVGNLDDLNTLFIILSTDHAFTQALWALTRKEQEELFLLMQPLALSKSEGQMHSLLEFSKALLRQEAHERSRFSVLLRQSLKELNNTLNEKNQPITCRVSFLVLLEIVEKYGSQEDGAEILQAAISWLLSLKEEEERTAEKLASFAEDFLYVVTQVRPYLHQPAYQAKFTIPQFLALSKHFGRLPFFKLSAGSLDELGKILLRLEKLESLQELSTLAAQDFQRLFKQVHSWLLLDEPAKKISLSSLLRLLDAAYGFIDDLEQLEHLGTAYQQIITADESCRLQISRRQLLQEFSIKRRDKELSSLVATLLTTNLPEFKARLYLVLLLDRHREVLQQAPQVSWVLTLPGATLEISREKLVLPQAANVPVLVGLKRLAAMPLAFIEELTDMLRAPST